MPPIVVFPTQLTPARNIRMLQHSGGRLPFPISTTLPQAACDPTKPTPEAFNKLTFPLVTGAKLGKPASKTFLLAAITGDRAQIRQ